MVLESAERTRKWSPSCMTKAHVTQDIAFKHLKLPRSGGQTAWTPAEPRSALVSRLRVASSMKALRSTWQPSQMPVADRLARDVAGGREAVQSMPTVDQTEPRIL